MSVDLKKILGSLGLPETTVEVVEEAFKEAAAVTKQTMQAEFDAKLEEATDTIREAALGVIAEAVADGIDELKQEIVDARTLEVKYATDLQVFKENYAAEQEAAVESMIAESVASVVAEMKDEIEIAKKNTLAIKLVESFGDFYATIKGDADQNLVESHKAVTAELAALKRDVKIAELTSDLTGTKKNIAMNILESVDYDRLDAKFESIFPLLTEAVVEAPADKKEPSKDAIILESDQSDEADAEKQKIYAKLQRSVVNARK